MWKICNTKVGQKGTLSRSSDLLLNFCIFFNIFATTEARDFKFGAHAFYEDCCLQMQN